MTTVRLNGSLADFRSVGRGRMRVQVADHGADLYDIDLFNVVDGDDIAARFEEAINEGIITDSPVSVVHANGSLLFMSEAGGVVVSGSQRRANEDQHIWGLMRVGDGSYPATHYMNSQAFAGDWSGFTNEITRLRSIGLRNFYLYAPWGFEPSDGPGYHVGTLAPGWGGGNIACYESGARLLPADNPGVLAFVTAWTAIIASIKADGGQVVFEPGAPPFADATGWESEVVASGADIGLATGGGIDPTSSPAPSIATYAPALVAGGTKVYLEPGDATTFAQYATWQDGTYGTINNRNRAALIVAGGTWFRAHPGQSKNLLFMGPDETGESVDTQQQLDASPPYIKMGFEALVDSWTMNADQAEAAAARSGDTDLFDANLLARGGQFLGLRLRSERQSRIVRR